MRVADCYYLGQIRKPHGIHGALKVYFDVDFIEDYEEQESVYVLRGEKLTPVFFESLRIVGPNLAIAHFRDVPSRDAAAELSGSEMYLPLDQLPELSPHQFYYHEIVGFQVIDDKLGELGKVLRVEEMPVQDLLVMHWQEKEVLVPLNYDIVTDVDKEKGIVYTTLPPGLLEVYLG